MKQVTRTLESPSNATLYGDKIEADRSCPVLPILSIRPSNHDSKRSVTSTFGV
jgi:hypothetical protein